MIQFAVVLPNNVGGVRRPTVVKQSDPEQIVDKRSKRRIDGVLGKRAHNM
jgi:hypothetical protein